MVTEAKIVFPNYKNLIDRVRKLMLLVNRLVDNNKELEVKIKQYENEYKTGLGENGTKELKEELKRLKQENKRLKEKEYKIKTKIERLAVKLEKIQI